MYDRMVVYSLSISLAGLGRQDGQLSTLLSGLNIKHGDHLIQK